MSEIYLRFDAPVPAVVQDSSTGQILMIGYMNREAYEKTRQTGLVWFWSRSRGRLWQKGETSGNVLRVKEMWYDCDGDAVLVVAEPTGPTCHTGQISCFFHKTDLETGRPMGPLDPPSFLQRPDSLQNLAEVIKARHQAMPEGSYTAYLLKEGIDKIAKKLGEEVAEVIVAAKNGVRDRIVEEMTDLLYHSLVLLEATGIDLTEVYSELSRRARDRSLEPRQ